MHQEEDKIRKILKVEVSGEDATLWNNLKSKLIGAIDKFLDSAIDIENGTTIREEAQKLTSLAINYAEEKLKKAGVENDKVRAEIDEIYANVEKSKAEARKLRAESRSIEFHTSIKQLTLSLKLTKALILGKDENESIILTKQIDSFLDALKEFSEDKNII